MSKLSPLAVALAALLTSNVVTAASAGNGNRFFVTSCADDGRDGTLRSAVALAGYQDTIDLTRLQCSRITLEQGVLRTSASIVGPGADRLTIDGNYQDRVFDSGAISITGATITHGLSTSVIGQTDVAAGGCITALGVTLVDAAVVDCIADGARGAAGGGIQSQYYVSLTRSTVSGNVAMSDGGNAYGGGIAAPYASVFAEASEISDNTAIGADATSRGGAFFVWGGFRLVRSTLAGNSADLGGAIYQRQGSYSFGHSEIFASTLSGNTASKSGGGAFLVLPASLTIASSTITLNSAQDGDVGGILMTIRADAPYGSYLAFVDSSIIANNAAPASTLAADIDVDHSESLITFGDENILTSVGHFVPDTYTIADPMLAPLAANGGPTRTHALMPGSPAIDAGSDAANLGIDQRGNARVAGPQADIGAYELQPDSILADGFDAAG
jgi:hypothetical protein